jgi:hypothetical protein
MQKLASTKCGCVDILHIYYGISVRILQNTSIIYSFFCGGEGGSLDSGEELDLWICLIFIVTKCVSTSKVHVRVQNFINCNEMKF